MWVLPGDQLVAYWSEVGVEDGSDGGGGGRGGREGAGRNFYFLPLFLQGSQRERDNTLSIPTTTTPTPTITHRSLM